MEIFHVSSHIHLWIARGNESGNIKVTTRSSLVILKPMKLYNRVNVTDQNH